MMRLQDYISRGSKDKARQICNEQLTYISDDVDSVLDQMETSLQEQVNATVTSQTALGTAIQGASMAALVVIAALLVFAIICSLRAVAPIKQVTGSA